MASDRKYKAGMIKGAIWLTISGLIVKFLGLIYKIPLSYILSDEGMGYFNSAYTVYTFFFIICSAGIPKAISILTSEAASEGAEERVGEIYKTALLIFTAFGTAVTLFFLFSAEPIAKLIGNSRAYFTMIAIAPSILFTCISGVIRGYFNGTLNFVPIAVSEALSGVGRLVMGIAFAWLGYRLNYALEIISALTILGTTVGSFLGFVCLLIYKKTQKTRVKTQQKKSLRIGSPQIAKKLFRLSVPITLTAAVGSISSIIDLAVIMKRLQSMGFSELQAGIIYGNYTTLAIPMLNLIGTMVLPLTTVLLPFVSKKTADTTPKLISERISFIVEIMLFFTIPATVIFSFRAKEILVILFEDSSAVMASPLLEMLAPAMLFMSLTAVLNTALEGMGDTKIPLISLVFGALIKSFLTVILVGNRNFEILGAPISTGVSYAVSFFISLCYIKFVKKIDVKIFRYALPFLFSSIVTITICGVVKRSYFDDFVLHYVGELGLFVLVYIFLVSLFKYKYFKMMFLDKINKKTTKRLYK